MPISRGEKWLGTELISSLAIRTYEGVRDKDGLGPEKYWGIAFTYGMLGLAGGLGPGPAEVAGAFGGLVLLAIAFKAVPAVKSRITPPVQPPGSSEPLPGEPWRY